MEGKSMKMKKKLWYQNGDTSREICSKIMVINLISSKNPGHLLWSQSHVWVGIGLNETHNTTHYLILMLRWMEDGFSWDWDQQPCSNVLSLFTHSSMSHVQTPFNSSCSRNKFDSILDFFFKKIQFIFLGKDNEQTLCTSYICAI
jgi:hypothetical protein